MIVVKVHHAYRDVIAVCDADLIDKKFEEGKRQIDARANFYKDKELNYEKAVKLMKEQAKEDATFNIVGKNSIKAALEAGIIAKEGIAKVQGVPFALVLS
ncbi:MAG: DUF424 family protein [Nanoarchaeota archaeon]